VIHEVRIQPRSALALVGFAEFWRHRDLLSMLVWRDFAVRYKQTILGPIWFVLQPLLPAIVFTLIFGAVARMSTEGIPAFLFFLSNQIVWGYFSANYSSTATCLITNLHLFTKVYFPRLIVPVASLVTNGINVVVQLGILAVAWLWFQRSTPEDTDAMTLSFHLAWLPLLFLLAAAQGLGFGLWMAALTAKYRDLQQLSAVIVQLWMYGSAVIFPLSQVPPEYQQLLLLNPVTFTLEASRFSLFGTGTLSWQAGVYSIGMTLVVLMGGLFLFNRTSRSFVDIA